MMSQNNRLNQRGELFTFAHITRVHSTLIMFLPGKCAHSAIHPKIRLEMAPMLDDPVMLTYL